MFAVLNYAWVAVWLAGVLLWCRDTRRSNRVGRIVARGAMALACSAVLLFPVISADDDFLYVNQTCDAAGFCAHDVSKGQSDHIVVFVNAGFSTASWFANKIFGNVSFTHPDPTFELITHLEVRPPPIHYSAG